MTKLAKDEEIGDLLRCDLRIIQSKHLPKFGLEGVLLANFPRVKDGFKICDLCSGNGIVPLLLTSRAKRLKITAIEVQPELCDLNKRSIELNNLQQQIEVVCIDLKQYAADQGTFDLVTANPPFYDVKSGEISANLNKAIARTQVHAKILDIVDTASGLLTDRGSISIVYRASGLEEVLDCLQRYDFGAIRIRFVHHTVLNKASSFILEATKHYRGEMQIGAPIIINKSNGELTREIQGVYYEGKPLESGLG